VIVALVGDSHAAQWFPALEVLAKRHDWRLEVFTKISCRFVDLPIYSRELKREYMECERWRELVVSALQQLKPDLVVVSAARGMAVVNQADDSPRRSRMPCSWTRRRRAPTCRRARWSAGRIPLRAERRSRVAAALVRRT
jgi:hypothetical protein